MRRSVLLLAAIAVVLSGASAAWASVTPARPQATVKSDSGSTPDVAAHVMRALGAQGAVWAGGTLPEAQEPEESRRVVIAFARGHGKEAGAAARGLGGTLLRRSRAGSFIVVDAPAKTSSRVFASKVARAHGVKYAAPDRILHAMATPNDPKFSSQWGIARIGAPVAWDVTRGWGVKVAVVDSGVDLDHEDLVDRLDTANDYDFVNGDTTADDDNGHGTHLAGIVGATMNNGVGVAGVANLCSILPVKVTNSSGWAYESDVALGIFWAADHGANVINLSMGTADYPLLVDAAVQYAASQDCVVVAAVGNDAASSVSYPAALDNVIGVGSTTSNDSRSGFSNYGQGLDVVAPGSGIYSTTYDGGYSYHSGTSMAAAHVAGVVALIRASRPSWSRWVVEQQLVATCLPLGSEYFGQGLVSAAAAVPVGTDPQATTINPVTNKVYIANPSNNKVTVIDRAANTTSTVTAGAYPCAMAVNPVTNKVYVANRYSRNVTVIDGATNEATTVAAGMWPQAVAINPVTNKVYVANVESDSVTVIDGATNATTTIAAGKRPQAIAVNPVTDKVYVANLASGDVTLIDGATNEATTVVAGTGPWAITVNPVTNKAYVANYASNDVTIIDASTNTTTVAVGTAPQAIAVNPVSNTLYVGNARGNDLTVIDGATDATISVVAGGGPFDIAVNPTANQVYVANCDSSDVTVIDGETNNTTLVGAGPNPRAINVNPVTNKAYVANHDGSVTVIDGAANGTTNVAAGTSPQAVAVNPATNKAYVANADSNDVTVIDGVTAEATAVAVGSSPQAVAVNPITDKVYVANAGSNDVTVIDGATNVTTTVAAGTSPRAITVNPVTDRVYVANAGSNDVTVIDGVTNEATTVAVGRAPQDIAVNPVTNRVYVANHGSRDVTVIYGATNATTAVAAGADPWAIAVNPVTNKIYVENDWSDNVTVIDGATNATTTVAVGLDPRAVAVNPVTNKVYVVNAESNGVTIIDGATNRTTTVAAGSGPCAIAVNPVTNKVYVSNRGSGNVTIIDGATNQTTYVAAGTGPLAVAVNPVTNRAYVPNHDSGDVTVIGDQDDQDVPLTTSIVPISGDATSDPTPTFSFTAATAFAPTAPAVAAVYYQVDALGGPWSKAATTTTGWSGTTGALAKGVHVLYAFAADGQLGDSAGTGAQSSPLIGRISAYVFLVGEGDIIYTITATAGSGGSISPAGVWPVAEGADAAFTVTPDVGYHVVDVLVDGVSVGAVGSYTFTNVTADHTIEARFAVETYTITATAGSGGSISPSGARTVARGDSATFTVTPSAGHFITDVLVDGVSVGVVGSYTFTNVTANHTIEAIFGADTYTITATAGSGGSITPTGTVTVAHGDSATFTMTPVAGYRVSDVLVDGTSVGAMDSYTFANVTATHTIEAQFSFVAAVTRIYGSDRYAVAANMARQAWDPAGDLTFPGVHHVIVACGEPGKEADPLCAAGLAGVYDAPIVLTKINSLPALTRDVIAQMAAANPGLQVHIVGGTPSVPDARWTDIKRIAGVSQTKDRISGADRYGVTANLAKRMVSLTPAASMPGVLVVCASDSAAFYDALAASPASFGNTMPMVAVRTGSVPDTVRGVLTSELAGLPRWVVSSPTYVSDAVAGGSAVSASGRLTSSADRYTAACDIADAAVSHGWSRRADTAITAKLSDALGGGALTGKIGGVMLYTTVTSSIQPTTASWISLHHGEITHGWIYGGTPSVPVDQETEFSGLLR